MSFEFSLRLYRIWGKFGQALFLNDSGIDSQKVNFNICLIIVDLVRVRVRIENCTAVFFFQIERKTYF